MKKHIVLKACVLLVIMFFHSFVLVPRVHATSFEGLIARIGFRAMSPAAMAALSSGTAMVVGVSLGVGLGYVILKSGAVDALQDWVTSYYQSAHLTDGTVYNPSPPAGCGWINGAASVDIFYGNMGQGLGWVIRFRNSQGNVCGTSPTPRASFEAAYAYATNGCGSYTPPPLGPNPVDLGTPLASSQPNFASGDVWATPGTIATLNGAAAIASVATMTNEQADNFVSGAGATSVTDAGVQDGTIPAANDNTVTSGDAAQLSLLQQIINFVSNLVGIKTGVESIKTTSDNALVVAQSQVVKLDNVAALSQSSLTKLDNIASISSAQSAKLDNIATGINTQTTAINDTKTAVQHLDNTVLNVTATSSTVASRIDSLKTAASTKFPFSLAGSLSVSTPSVSSTYAFTSLPLTPNISIPIDPLAGPLHDFFVWVRQLLVWFMWAGTLFAILRKGMEM